MFVRNGGGGKAARLHGENLLAIFPHATERDPIALCRKLRRLELAGHRLAERRYNDPMMNYDLADMQAARLVTKLNNLLGFVQDKIPVVLNWDARGYALKIARDYVSQHRLAIMKDLGGYGIIAPDLPRSASAGA